MQSLTMLLAQCAVLALGAGLLSILAPRRERIRVRAEDREPRR